MERAGDPLLLHFPSAIESNNASGEKISEHKKVNNFYAWVEKRNFFLNEY